MIEKIFYVDVETTGTDEDSEIYEVSFIIEIDGQIQLEAKRTIRPEVGNFHRWVVDNLKSKNLSVEDIMSVDYTYKDFRDELLQVLNNFVNPRDKTDKFHICGYNVHFDIKYIIKDLFHRFGDDYFYSYFWSDPLDVMRLASFVLKSIRHNLTSFKLTTLCKIFDIEIDAHDSLSDIKATRKLYSGLKNYYNLKPIIR